MRLKQLKIENIRSYKFAAIDFPAGSILFEGDIGSGKSTILYAIEFALFGLGELKGDALLKKGARRGSVLLTFQIRDDEYKVYRMLVEKNNVVSQEEGYIETNGEREILSSSEMRAKILNALNFKENIRPRSSSLIYRYAIFTPQEEMKEVLRLRPDERLQTLRKAFGVEDYKIAKDNTKLIIRKITEDIRFTEGAILDIDAKKAELKGNKDKMESCRISERLLNKRHGERKEVVSNLKNSLKKLEIERDLVNKLKTEIPHMENELSGKKDLTKELKFENEKLEKKIQEIENKINELNKIKKPTEKDGKELNREIEELAEKIRNKEIQLGKVQGRLQNYEKLIKEKICPTCEREIEHVEFDAKIKETKSEQNGMEKELENLSEARNGLKKLFDELRDYRLNKIEMERLASEKTGNEARIKENENKMEELKNKIKGIEKEMAEKKKDFDEKKIVFKKIEKLESELDVEAKKLEDVSNKLTTITTEIRLLSDASEKLKKELEKKEEQKKRKEILQEQRIWLSDYFTNALDNIEKHVMASINEDFNMEFSKWFDMLMENSDINVEVDEDFTPLVEQNGYQIDVNYLSGGEKTSVALAYRLALNMTVRAVCASMKSNLLILDEPTDGFSKEQLFKLRDVLDELKCDQTIIVSHERELESFVDKVYRIVKDGANSRIIEA